MGSHASVMKVDAFTGRSVLARAGPIAKHLAVEDYFLCAGELQEAINVVAT
jgi:hypothetical protein